MSHIVKRLGDLAGRVNARVVKRVVVAGAVLASASSALAVDPTPADMGSITLPVSVSSIVSGVFTTGGLAAAALIALIIGFAIFWRVAHRAKRAF